MAAVPVGGALYVAQKSGQVLVLQGGQVTGTVLDISSQVSTGSEQGLLGIAVAGNHLYVDYTDTAGDTHVVEYTLAGDRASSPRQLLFQKQPYANHNGGQLVFGPDGKLYIGLGDGGSAGDPQRQRPEPGTWLGKILRIDPTPSGGQPYTVPGDNPFVGRSGAKPEIWAYGLRNPWRFTFDRANGDLWIGDVGQNAWEEVDHVAAGRGGQNYEWGLREGSTHAHQGGREAGGRRRPRVRVRPQRRQLLDHRRLRVPGQPHTGACGGPTCSPTTASGRYSPSRVAGRAVERPSGQLSSFAEDAPGEVYALSLSGGLYRLDPA